MALKLTLDYPSKVTVEPGYNRTVTANELADNSDLDDQGLWADPLLSTVMLKPRQLDPNWIDTVQQLDSIIRKDDLIINTTDDTNRRIVERALGNNADPWIWVMTPAFPFGFFPSAVGPGAPPLPPGAPTALTSIPVQDIPEIDITQFHPHDIYEEPTTLPPAATPPTPVRTGGYENAATVARTNFRTEPNQALFFRWKHPAPGPNVAGLLTSYIFHVGQFALHARDVTLQVWEDTSPHGDRTAGVKRLGYPLWGYQSEAEEKRARAMNSTVPWNLVAHDRWLLWLPFRRNKVLLLSNLGRAVLLHTRPENQVRRNEEDTDWVNVRSDTIQVKVLCPVFTRFQIQLVKYPAAGILAGPVSVLPYPPANEPLLIVQKDEPRGSTIITARSNPASYSRPRRAEDDCPPAGADPPSWLVSKHGVKFALTSPAGRRWTPFLYGYQFHAPAILGNSSLTPEDVNDTGAGTRLIEAEFSLDKKPGRGRGKAEVLDFDPFPMSDKYYRSAIPVRLTDGAVNLFTGWTEPIEMTPLHEATTKPRRLTVPILDGWKLLSRSHVKNHRDFAGTGHITAVLELIKEAGINVTVTPIVGGGYTVADAEVPPINSTALDRQWNTKLGGEELLSHKSGAVVSPWATRSRDTYASFIQRIGQQFSGWDIGFRADGTFFYLPEDYFTTPALTFYASQAARTLAASPTSPLFRDPVTFTTEEPEANVILVRSGKATDGAVTYSRYFVDWASIKNPLVVNYLGQWRALVIQVAGGFTCPQLNWTARTIWKQTRRRFIGARWEGDYRDTLKIGHVVTLGTYGTYRLTSMRAQCVRVGWRPAIYEGVLLEKGYGVP